MEWKKHVFADLQPYICTFANCKAGLDSYTTRKAWADHEFSVHRKDKIWICSDCAAEFHNKQDMREHAYSSHGYVLMRNQLEALVNAAERSAGTIENSKCPFCLEVPGIKSRAFAMHVGRHMEEIALAVLPRDSEFEEDRGSMSSNRSAAGNPAEEAKNMSRTENAGLTKGLPPGWNLKHTDSGRAYSTNRAGRVFWGETPNLSKDQWELEFCHALVVELLELGISEVIAPFIKENFTNAENEQSEPSETPSSLVEIQENLRRNMYSNAGEFREEVLKLEHTIKQTKSESANTASLHFRQIFDTKWSQMDNWLHNNEASWPKEDPKLVGNIASSAIQPGLAQEHAGPQSKNVHTNIDQFNFLAVLGKGHGAKIMLAESKSNKRLYAIKIVRKEILVENDEVEGPKIEKNIYLKAREHDHPFITPLISTFQTETRLYFVLEYCPGGDLMYHIRQAAFSVIRSK